MKTRNLQIGVTVIELIAVMLIVALVSVYFVSQNISSSRDLTAASQAQKMASDLRHAQNLATTWGKSLCIVVVSNQSPNYYYVSLNEDSGCSSSPVSDPANNGLFKVELQNGVMFTQVSSQYFYFNSLGMPSSPVSYVLSGNIANTVYVEAISGRIRP